ncbi:ATP-binding cassette domain-containing protein, partial [Listeria monocytogenes]|nr:ATP-binding cassette domain-containing protein [Listeria monocytogenes]
MIRFDNVSKKYSDDKTAAVNNVTLDIKDGEFFVFIGPSGCGKTTTLKMI